MKSTQLLLLTAAASCASAASYPYDMGLDLVFPGKGTYKNVTEMPIVFAIRNADAAFQFGYQIAWNIEKATTSDKVTSGGMPYGNIIQSSGADAPVNAVNNTWYATGAVDSLDDLPAGDYSLRWKWIMTYCNSSVTSITYRPSRTVASGSVNFTLAADAADMDLTKDCPVFLTQIKVQDVQSGNCPDISSTDDKLDPCGAKMSQDMATCVLANLTETSDNGACAKLVRADDDDDEDSSSGSNNSTTNSTGDSTSTSDKDNSSSVVTAANIWTAAFLAAIGGMLLV